MMLDLNGMQTVNSLYLEVRKKLAAAQSAAPGLEAREITGRAVGIGASSVIPMGYKYIPDSAVEEARRLLELRLGGMPLAYILGQWDFLGRTYKVTPDVLIPRGDTETLALEAVGRLREMGESPRVLDLCCGSGCVGLSIIDALPNVRLTMCDVSPKALIVAKENAKDFNSLICIVEADALGPPPGPLRGFDMIVCNPPYIARCEWESLDREVARHEPRLALDGGADGLDFYRSVTELWGAALDGGGLLLFETGFSQAGAVAEIMSAGGFLNIEVKCDLAGVQRVVAGKKYDIEEKLFDG